MDPIILTVVFKGVCAMLIIVFGFLIARYGYHLYKDGAGSGRDQAAFEAGPIKIKAQSVGSVIMGTAFLWAWAGVAISPNLDKKGEDWKVSLSTPDLNLKSFAIAAALSSPNQEIKNDPKELKKLFEIALKSPETDKGKVVKLNGKPAAFDPQSIRTLKSETGYYLIATDIKTEDRTATLTYEPKVQNDRVIFVPTGIGVSTANEKK